MRHEIVVCLILGASVARAQPSGPPPAPDAPAPPPAPSPAPPDPVPTPDPVTDDAKRHFEQGAALFNDGNYLAALAEFEESYRIKPAAFVFFNIGLTQKALFRYAEAIASLQRYLDETPTLAVERRDEAEKIIREMKALLADVTLDVAPAGATVAVDGRPMGTAPLPGPLGIAAGSHTVEVTAPGFHPQKRELMIAAGVPLTLKVQLVAIPKTGKVRIATTVRRARISIDGRRFGLAPVEVELTPGGHSVEVTAPDYLTRREDIAIAAGQTRTVTISLDRIVHEQRWYRKWWVWTAVGVAAGGVTVFGLAGGFGSTQSPLEGTLAPGAGGVQ